MKKRTIKAVQGIQRQKGELPPIPAGKTFKSKKDYDRRKEKKEVREATETATSPPVYGERYD